jgi:DNA-binding transcriptional regulator YiaG
LPFAAVTLKALKPKETDVQPQTLGEHLRTRRLTLGLSQAEAGLRLGASQFTVMNWELERRWPRAKRWAAILAFLGYDPRPNAARCQTAGRAS